MPYACQSLPKREQKGVKEEWEEKGIETK